MGIAKVKSVWESGDLVFKTSAGTEIMRMKGTDAKVSFRPGTAAGEGLSPLVWSDCPQLDMLLDPTLGFFKGDDFQALDGTTELPYTFYTDTSDTFTSLAAQVGGVARVSLSGTDNDEGFVVYNQSSGIVKAGASNDWWFEARVKPSQVTKAHGIFIGLAEEGGVGVDLMNTDDMVLKVIDAIGFQIISASDGAACAVIQTIIQLNGGARVAVDATAGTATAAYIKFGMKSESGTVTFYLNGVALDTTVATTATNFPLDQVMCPTFGVKIGQASAETMDIDWWYAAQLR